MRFCEWRGGTGALTCGSSHVAFCRQISCSHENLPAEGYRGSAALMSKSSCAAAESIADAIHDNRMLAERAFYCMANGAGELDCMQHVLIMRRDSPQPRRLHAPTASDTFCPSRSLQSARSRELQALQPRARAVRTADRDSAEPIRSPPAR